MAAICQEVTLLPLYCNKIHKNLLTLATIHDTLYRKSHQFCRKVQNGEDLFLMRIFTAPQHTRFILPLTSPDKIIVCTAWAVFSFMEPKQWIRRRPEA